MDRRDERELVLAAKAPDAFARRALVETFLPLIGGVARMYRRSPAVTHEELMQEGVVGLLLALGRYDPALETPFWAYAAWWVRQAMQRLVTELGGPFVLSDRALRELARLRAIEREAARHRGGSLTAGQLAARAGMREDHVEELLAARRRPRGLHEPAGPLDRAATVGDRLVDDTAQDAYEQVERQLEAQLVMRSIATTLDAREQAVLRQRFGFDGTETTLRAIARALGLSAERVRQIEAAALDKLRDAHGGADPAAPR